MADLQATRSFWVFLFALLGAGVTSGLGVWQLGRADQKQQLHDALEARQVLPLLLNKDVPCQESTWLRQEQRLAVLTGHWLHEHTVLLDNRPMQGRPGFLVLTPLHMTPAPATVGCQASVLLIQRGWLPRDPYDRARVPFFAKPLGEVQVPVRLTFAPSKTLSLQQAPAPEVGVLRQNVDMVALSREWRLALLPGSAQQTGPAKSASGVIPDDSLTRAWWQPQADVGKHHAYAAQWFLMAVVIMGLYGWFQWWRPMRAVKE